MDVYQMNMLLRIQLHVIALSPINLSYLNYFPQQQYRYIACQNKLRVTGWSLLYVFIYADLFIKNVASLSK